MRLSGQGELEHNARARKMDQVTETMASTPIRLQRASASAMDIHHPALASPAPQQDEKSASLHFKH